MWSKLSFYIEDFFPDFLTDLGILLLRLIIIITIMLVILEILKAFRIFNILNTILYYITKPLGISKSASMPLLIGILIGITYGAGVIIASYASNEMNKKDVILVGVFLSICHSIIEDTLIFASVGARGWIIALIRIFIAFIVTTFINIIINLKVKHQRTEIIDTNLS